ncbi:hypothetical protein SAMN02745166_01284 [Prosthecobacter debontii]|uniref:Uncharacterized protein n=1 Tax=Prosthecobacter debontii TaxID=48467 RepID=A0A1T4X9V5_9BACT|nr:hypothetical protein [Prosthecobacter debontii]SKA86343.1 hypothetical protein SAMN02745166_01284 [Prosthecobacter debontii]
MRSNVTRFTFVCLALLALGWAQVFGMNRGFICDCGGEVEITVFDHCHGPHGTTCHLGLSSAHDQEDHPESDDSQEHQPYKESVQAQKQLGQVAHVVIPALVVVALLEPLTPQLSLSEDRASEYIPPREDGGVGRSWPQVLTRTIALVI